MSSFLPNSIIVTIGIGEMQTFRLPGPDKSTHAVFSPALRRSSALQCPLQFRATGLRLISQLSFPLGYPLLKEKGFNTAL